MRVLIMLLLFACSLHAEEKSNVVLLPAGQVHEGDYFAMGSNVEISGEVTGDLYTVGSQVVVDGRVLGDVLAVGGSVIITGPVGGNIRCTGGQVVLGGPVGRSVTILSGAAQLMASASIGGNVFCITGTADLSAPIGGNVTLITSNSRLSSPIGGNVHAYVGQMRLTSKAAIGGDLDYTSTKEATIDPQVTIGGTLTHHLTLVKGVYQGHWIQSFLLGSKVAAILMNFIYSLVIGWVIIRIFPQTLAHSLEVLKNRPWKAFACGAVVLVLLPILFLLLLITVVGAPLALTVLALNVITFYSAKIFSIFWVANPLLKKIGMKPNKMGILSVGLIAYFLLTAVPYFGGIIAFLALIFGLGASVVATNPIKKLS